MSLCSDSTLASDDDVQNLALYVQNQWTTAVSKVGLRTVKVAERSVGKVQACSVSEHWEGIWDCLDCILVTMVLAAFSLFA